MSYSPYKNMIGGFSENDGTIDFYLRVNELFDQSSNILDLGAGRAAWFEDDRCETRKRIRLLKGKANKVIAADVDDAVLTNTASDEQLLMKDGEIDVKDGSIDLIVADYVLEHITEPNKFASQISRVLKSGGWFCARTPHKFSYVSIAASLVSNTKHSKVLKKIQPERNEVDVFPTAYKMNTNRQIALYFPNWINKSFVFRANPSYYFGREPIYKIQSTIHQILPKVLCGNLFIFIQKP